MPTIEVDVSHTTKPWMLICTRFAGERDHKTTIHCGTKEEALALVEGLKLDEQCYLIELAVDAGCYHAIG